MYSTQQQTLARQIREVILTDYAHLMNGTESTVGKFILIAVGIEFLGACLDKQHMDATARGEKRFNLALMKLFPKKYHHFVKKESVPNFWVDFRCPVIHQFKSGKSVCLCSAEEAAAAGSGHLSYNSGGCLVLVAEDFYQDLTGAGLAMIKKIEDPD
jgi:hypothetical protein